MAFGCVNNLPRFRARLQNDLGINFKFSKDKDVFEKRQNTTTYLSFDVEKCEMQGLPDTILSCF
jgi:hypothetical protein